MRANEVGNFFRAVLQRLQKKLRGRGLILIGRPAQQLISLLICRQLFVRRARKIKMTKSILFLKTYAVEKREGRVHAMPEHNVPQFVGEDRRETRFIRKHVDQSAAYNN